MNPISTGRGLLALALLLPGLLGCAVSAATDGGDTRSRLLARLDAALDARDRAALEKLTDFRGWGSSAEIAALELLLPPAPIRREKELSERELLYRDGDGRSWRLVLTPVEPEGWRIVARPRPCPPGGMQRRPMNEDAPAPTREPAKSWTPLECWPLPR